MYGQQFSTVALAAAYCGVSGPVLAGPEGIHSPSYPTAGPILEEQTQRSSCERSHQCVQLNWRKVPLRPLPHFACHVWILDRSALYFKEPDSFL